MRLLFAEDEPELNRILTEELTEEGYSVDRCFDGEEALSFLRAADYDGVILDVSMPKSNGFTVVEQMRKAGISTPVLFLTARDALEDRVRGLDIGGDDYLVKPFELEELFARIRALVRRPYRENTSMIVCEDLKVDLKTHEVFRGEDRIELSAREYSLLEYLAINKNIVLSRERIEEHVWNFDYEGGTNIVDVYISFLRKKIDEGRDRHLIGTVRGVGYVLRSQNERS